MTITFSKWSVVPVTVLLFGTVALAQTPATPAPGTPAPTVAERKENQQDRIAQGVKSGQLTAGETANLETKEAAINGETRADRAVEWRKAGRKQRNSRSASSKTNCPNKFITISTTPIPRTTETTQSASAVKISRIVSRRA